MIKKVFRAFISSIFLFLLSNFPCALAQERVPEITRKQWVDSVYEALTPEQRVGQLFMVAAYSNRSAAYDKELLTFVKNYQPGGILFMQGGPVRQAKLTNKLQSEAPVPLLIGMDLEWGLPMRLDSTITFPRQMILGALTNDSLIYAMGAEIARQMKIMGIHVNFAPVADVNNRRDNPVIGTRSFGEDKNAVARKAIAYSRGLQDHGVLSVAKHFPGHGDTNVDSHKALPVLPYSKQRLDTLETVPFRKLIARDVGGIMTGHLLVPSMDQDELPASLSPAVTQDYLRDELNFDGLVFTDALNMKAITDNFSDGDAELKAFLAGADVLLFSENMPAAARKISEAIGQKKALEKQLERAVKRILLKKYALGLTKRPKINLDNLLLRLNAAQGDLLALEMFKESVTVVSDRHQAVPVRVLDTKKIASVIFGDGAPFENHLQRYANLIPFDDKTSVNLLAQQLPEFDLVIVGIMGDAKMPDAATLKLLRELDKKTTVVICGFMSPYLLGVLDEFETVICGYTTDERAQLAVAEVLFGGVNASGRLPVAASEKFKAGTGVSTASSGRLSFHLPEAAGMDSRTLKKIDDLVAEAITDKATPGCQVLIAKEGKVVYSKSFGYYTYDSIKPVSDRTIYDLASLTKVMATTQAVMFLEEHGMIDLDKKLSVYLPELKGSNKENMIIRDILTHQAGLWTYVPFWAQTVDKKYNYLPEYYSSTQNPEFSIKVRDNLFTSPALRDSIWQWVIDSRLRNNEPGQFFDYKYSDLGFYMMQRLVEELTNQPMDEFLQQNFYDPLGMSSTGFKPLEKFSAIRIAPTEQDDIFRRALIAGMVHDQGAALYGGVAGHAGLFSSAIDLAKLSQMLVQKGEYGGTTYFRKETIQRFTAQQYDSNRRGLGWDKPVHGDWYGPTAEDASKDTFGHTGFTGTAVWIDPEFDLVYVFLSNRIHPDASNTKLLKANTRTRIQEVIYESIWQYRSTQVN